MLDSHIIHTHDPQITYSLKLQYLQTRDYIETGKTNSSGEVINLLNENNGVAILKLHGQIVTAKGFQPAVEKLLTLRKSLVRGEWNE